MASPPFNIDTANPEATDLISVFPSLEQDFRDIVESWLLLISTTSGVLRADAMPAEFSPIVTQGKVEVQALDAASDAELVISDETGADQGMLSWDRSDDAVTLTAYQDGGTTPRTTLKLHNDTAVAELTLGDLRVTSAGTNAASAVTVGATQTLTGKTLTSPAITGLDASTTAKGIIEAAVAAEHRANTAGILALTPAEVWSSAAEVTLTDAATIAVDMNTFFNATVTLGGNRTLGSPTNEKVGQTGCIRIVQDGTGTRTLAYGTDWEFAGGIAPVLSTPANSQDLLFYQVLATNRIFGNLIKAIA